MKEDLGAEMSYDLWGAQGRGQGRGGCPGPPRTTPLMHLHK